MRLWAGDSTDAASDSEGLEYYKMSDVIRCCNAKPIN